MESAFRGVGKIVAVDKCSNALETSDDSPVSRDSEPQNQPNKVNQTDHAQIKEKNKKCFPAKAM